MILSRDQYFTKLDLSEVNLQIEVDQESRDRLSINAHRVLYLYTIFPFSVKTAPMIFPHVMNNLMGSLSRTAANLVDRSNNELYD